MLQLAVGFVTISLCLISTAAGHYTKRYEPSWESLDSRPLPQWYDDAKVGIFIHWGVFSVPSFHSEWFWQYWKGDIKDDVVQFMERNYPPGWTYQDFAREFRAEFYDPEQWVDIFRAAGARYVVLTSKHHEGYTLWPSRNSFSWNAMDVGPRRDLVGDLAKAMQKTDIKFGLYHSLYEWFNPLWIRDRDSHFNTSDFVKLKTLPALYDLVNTYQPQVVWSDGEMEASDDYWQAKEFLAWLYNDSPVANTVVTNDRWGNGTACEHGDFYNCADRYSPGVLQPHKWENAITIDKDSWGYRRNAHLTDILTIEEILQELTKTVSCGGNLLINVGPTKDGIISPIYEERLRQMGSWLTVNGEGIYGSKPWTYQNDTLTPGVWYTKNGGFLYAFVWQWPVVDVLALEKPELSQNSTITLLPMKNNLTWEIASDFLIIEFPSRHLIQAEWVFVLKISEVLN